MKKQICFAILVTVLLAAACKKNGNTPAPGPGPGPAPNPGGNNDAVTITGSSPEYVFWGGELTITGTGFSTTKADNFVWLPGDDNCFGSNKEDSTDWKKAEVISATATKLVIKVPYSTNKYGSLCGNDLGSRLRVTVKGKKTVESSFPIRPMGFPRPAEFCYWYGGAYESPTVMRTGDSVLLEYSGAGMFNLHSTDKKDKIRLSVSNKPVPINLRKSVSGCGSYGVTFKLDPNVFGKNKCGPVNPVWGLAGEVRPFKLYIEGVNNAEQTDTFFVMNLPKASISDVSGPLEVSKSAGGHPFWKVTGKNMHYKRARIIPNAPCTGVAQIFETSDSGEDPFVDEFNIYIPLSIMNEGCSYKIAVLDACDVAKPLGTIRIDP